MAKLLPHADHEVVVIEDNEHTAHMLKFILERSGYTVRVALNGRAAREMVEASPAPDAVVLDLMLPYVSGEELIAIIRDTPDWRYVPILVLSGRVLEGDIVRAFELGVNDYVTKPFRPAELLVRLKRLIEARESMLFQTQSS